MSVSWLRAHCVLSSLCLPIVLCLGGCGNNDTTSESSAPANVSTGTSGATVEPASPEATQSANAVVAVNDPRTKWINGIPYDAFFDRPVEVQQDQTPVGSPPEDTVPPDPGTNPPPPVVDPTPAPMPAGGNDVDWTSIVSAELLNEGVTDIRNRLTANLQTVAAYNRSWEETALDGHTLAALAAVIETHPDEVSWKENAKYVRDLGYEIFVSADGTGRSAYEPTQQSFESIVTILSGGPPPDMESDALSSFADVIDRGLMMEQIEKTFNWLKADINTETRLDEDADRVAREASVLVAFGAIMRDEGYDYTDEPDYRMFAKDFVDGSRAMVSASNAEVRDFESFQSGRNAVQTSCGVCHQKYRGSDTGF